MLTAVHLCWHTMLDYAYSTNKLFCLNQIHYLLMCLICVAYLCETWHHWQREQRDPEMIIFLDFVSSCVVAKGRTNMELREKFMLADGASQSMAAFRPRGRRSRPSSRGGSPNRSTSVSNPPAQTAPTPSVTTSTPKVRLVHCGTEYVSHENEARSASFL